MMVQNVSHNYSSVDDSGKSSVNIRYSPGYVVGLCLLAILIFLVNFLVIYLFSTRETLRTDTNRILASLAVSDMINGVVTIPLLISANHDNSDKSLHLAAMVLYRFIATSTMLHMLVVTLERHICVIYPLHYNGMVTKRRIIVTLCIVWIISIFYAVIGLSWLGLASNYNHRQHPPVLSDSKLMQIEFSYTIIGFLFWFFIPLVIMSYSFAKILREISRHNRRESELMLGVDPESAHIEAAVEDRTTKLRTDRKPVLIFIAMLLVFTFSWLTWYIQIFIVSVAPQHSKRIHGTAYLFNYLRAATSLINPLLYSLIKKDFRMVLKKIIVHAKTQGRDILTRPSNEFTLKSLHTADTI